MFDIAPVFSKVSSNDTGSAHNLQITRQEVVRTGVHCSLPLPDQSHNWHTEDMKLYVRDGNHRSFLLYTWQVFASVCVLHNLKSVWPWTETGPGPRAVGGIQPADQQLQTLTFQCTSTDCLHQSIAQFPDTTPAIGPL